MQLYDNLVNLSEGKYNIKSERAVDVGKVTEACNGVHI
jgi:hypothetical protein